jgi:outer membrane phospholipase A
MRAVTRLPFILALGFGCAMLLSLPRSAVSQETGSQAALTPTASDFTARISGYEPSFIGWVFDDEPHARFQISIRYPFMPFAAFDADPNAEFFGGIAGFYVAYTGVYDIYFQRESAPTISREHNPGFYFRFDNCFHEPLILTTGYFHESNGQFISTREQYQAIPEHAQDFVSRSWDYLLLGARFTLPGLDEVKVGSPVRFIPGGPLQIMEKGGSPSDPSKLSFRVQGLYFLDKTGFGGAWREDDVFWEDVSAQPHISDYDGIRLTVIIQNAYYRLSDTLRTGYTASHLTNDLSLTFRIGKWLPLSIQWHAGYGPNPSDYHIYSKYFTLGCELYGLE